MVTTRAGNVIGAAIGHRTNYSVASGVASSEPVVLGSKATRPWQHVLDTLYGYLHLGGACQRSGAVSGAWNFGPEIDTGLTVRQLAERTVSEWGAGEVAGAEALEREHKLLQLNIVRPG